MLDSEYNDQMVYAHQRFEELLFQGQNAGLGRCGSRAVQRCSRQPMYLPFIRLCPRSSQKE